MSTALLLPRLLQVAGCTAFPALAWLLIIRREVEVNARLIQADGAADTLKNGFHQHRTWLRLWAWLACVAAGAGPLGLAYGWQTGCWAAAGLGFLLAGIFARTFNPQLNVALGLSYKARFYASPSPTAARWPDQYVWGRLRSGKAEPTQDNANFILQHYLNFCLWFSTAAYVGFMAAALIAIK